MFVVPDSGVGTTFLLDTFIDVNGTALASHTPNVGGPWTDTIAGWNIESNHLTATAPGSPNSKAPTALNQGFLSVTANLNGMPSGDYFFAQAYHDASNYVYVAVYGDGMIDSAIIAGAVTVASYQSQAGTFGSGVHTVQLVYSPNAVTVSIDGTVIAVFPTAVYAGLTAVQFDLVASLAGPDYPLISEVEVQGS